MSELPSKRSFARYAGQPACVSSVVSLFKKYIIENEGKETMNHINLYLDIEAYYNISDSGGAAGVKNSKQKKDIQSSFVYK